MAAFYVMITGIFRFGVNDCKLVDSFFDLVKEVGIIHHVGGYGHSFKSVVNDGSKDGLGLSSCAYSSQDAEVVPRQNEDVQTDEASLMPDTEDETEEQSMTEHYTTDTKSLRY